MRGGLGRLVTTLLIVLLPVTGVGVMDGAGELAQGAVPATGQSSSWEAWTSSPSDASARLVAAAPVDQSPTRTIELSPGRSLQTWQGVGAALTDSAAGILRRSPEATSLLFDPARSDGARLNLLRLPLSATDFSTTPWTFGWDDADRRLSAPPVAVSNADFVADDLVRLRPDLRVVAVPWTSPPEMKDSGSVIGGALRSDKAAAYGRLLEAQAGWLVAQGVPLTAMTLGNEPFHSSSGPGGYPTMTMSDAQMISLARQVGPGLATQGVDLWAVDHNWQHRSHYDAVLSGAPGAFAAAAFHCYGGSPADMAGVAVPPIVTECTGTNDGFAGTFRWDMANLVVGSIAAGSTGLMMWNLALDENHGPHTGGCGTCRGVVDVHSGTGTVAPTPEFYTLAHVSRAADPGAAVIGTGTANGLRWAAFRNPDGRIGVVGHNDTGAAQVLELAVDGESSDEHFRVGNGEMFTIRGWDPVVPGSVELAGGPARVGAPLTVSADGWGPSPVSLTYQWLADGVAVEDATDRTFSPGAAQVGARLAVRVTGSRTGFRPATTTSPSTDPVAPDDEHQSVVNLVPPQVTGTPRVGERLTVSPGEWSPEDAVLTYQWLRSGVPVNGATTTDHVVTPADAGAMLSVSVTAAYVGMTSTARVAEASGPVATAGPIRVDSPGLIRGALRVGRTMRVVGVMTTPAAEIAYRWLRNGHPIRATGGAPTYRLVGRDRGARLGVQLILSAPGYDSATVVLRRPGVVRRG